MTSFSVYYPSETPTRMATVSHHMATQLLLIDRYAEGIKAIPKDIVGEWISVYAQRYSEIYEEGIHDIEDIEVRLYKVVIPI